MSRRHRAKRPRSHARRNLVLFAVAIAALGGLIAWVGNMKRAPERILPPESPEVTAKRKSDENAFYTLVKPWPEIQQPDSLMVPYSSTNPKLTEPYEPRMHSIGQLLGIKRPDDDKQLAMYMYTRASVVANAQEALAKEYFLLPAIGTPLTRGQYEGEYFFGKLDFTVRLLTAYMLHAVQQSGNAERAAGYFSDAVRLAEMLGTDGGFGQYAYMAEGLRTVLQCGADAARSIENPEHLIAMRAVVNRITLHEPDALPHLEFELREMDNWAQIGFQAHLNEVSRRRGRQVRRRRNPLRFVQGALEAWQFKRTSKALRERHQELIPIGDLSYREFEARREGDLTELAESLGLWGGYYPIERFITAREGLYNAVNAADMAFSLELYRRDHGAYPQTLDALVPDYIESVPSTVYPDTPFIYRVEGDDYWLYPGPEREEAFDKVNEKKLYELVFHCPPMATRDGI